MLTAVLVALLVLLVATLILPRLFGVARVAWFAWPGYVWFGLVVYLFLTLLVLEPVRLALRGWVKRDARPPIAASPTDAGDEPAGVPRPGQRRAAGAASVGLVGVGMANALGPPDLLRVPVRLRRLDPAFNGFRIAVVSDIHLGPLAGRAHTERIVAMINEAEPDLVAIVGDLVDGTVAGAGFCGGTVAGLGISGRNVLRHRQPRVLRRRHVVLAARAGAARRAAAAQREHGDPAWCARPSTWRASTTSPASKRSDPPDFDRALSGVDRDPGRRFCLPTNRFR